MPRQAYNTRQRELVVSLMRGRARDYLTVDRVCELLRQTGLSVGRTTVYRTLERLVSEGAAAKVAGIRGEAAQYRVIDAAADAGSRGQLRCTRCGRALPLDCEMFGAFKRHVLREHGFAIDQRQTVIYGLCADCRAAAASEAVEAAPEAAVPVAVEVAPVAAEIAAAAEEGDDGEPSEECRARVEGSSSVEGDDAGAAKGRPCGCVHHG